MTSDKKEAEEKLNNPKENPRITEATQQDWDDFFAVQEDNVFDR